MRSMRIGLISGEMSDDNIGKKCYNFLTMRSLIGTKLNKIDRNLH